MTHLHVHTEFSLGDSTIKIPKLIQKCKRLNFNAVAITDHGTLAGAIFFRKECLENEIKPIIGCEFYHQVEPQNINYHLVLLAKNYEGYLNLVALNNAAINNFYRRPRITDEMIKLYSNGLICMTACIQGYFPQTIISGNPDWSWYKMMVDIFGEDFYLEIQNSGIDEQELIRDFAAEENLNPVATADCHYLDEEDDYVHLIALGIRYNKNLEQLTGFSGSGYYVKSEKEMFKAFSEESVKLTDEISEKITTYDIGHKSWNLPKKYVDEKKEHQRLTDKLIGYIGNDFKKLEQYKKQLDYEFKIIRDNGFLPYFKVVASVCEEIDSLNILRGWGRGSVVGSLVAFLYNITKIDPIPWGLYFERFLNPERVSPPDIDLDFMPETRDLVMDAFKKLFSGTNVCQVGTFTTLATRATIDRINKVTGVGKELKKYVPLIIPTPKISELLDSNDDFRKKALDIGGKKYLDTLQKIAGLRRSHSIHASGVVVCNRTIPLHINKTGVHSGTISTDYDMATLDLMQEVKYDILGVKTLSILSSLVSVTGVTIENISKNLNDPNIYNHIQETTTGVFQMESETCRDLIKRIKPGGINELVNLIAINRPGPLESGIAESYIKRKWKEEPAEKICDGLENTYELPIYQEDIMRIAVNLAGFTLPQADTLRKAIGKKEAKSFDKIKNDFISGCVKNRHNEEKAIDLWGKIERFARYGFNKAHSVAYAYIAYWTAWFSYYYPCAFLCEMLNDSSDIERKRIILLEAFRRNICVRPPDINISDIKYKVHNEDIYIGFSGIKYLGQKTAEKIFKEREVSPFKDKEDFLTRVKPNKRVLGQLQRINTFGDVIPTAKDEIEILGFSSNVFTNIWWRDFCPSLCQFISFKEILTKNHKKMAFIKVFTASGQVKEVTVFPPMWQKMTDFMLKIGDLMIISVESGRNVLKNFTLQPFFDKMKVVIEDEDGLLALGVKFVGRPNIFGKFSGIACINLTEKNLRYLDENFGISKIFI
jgi:DNA polymerase-3 subunit alpha